MGNLENNKLAPKEFMVEANKNKNNNSCKDTVSLAWKIKGAARYPKKEKL